MKPNSTSWDRPPAFDDENHSADVDGHEWRELGIMDYFEEKKRIMRIKRHRVVRSLRRNGETGRRGDGETPSGLSGSPVHRFSDSRIYCR